MPPRSLSTRPSSDVSPPAATARARRPVPAILVAVVVAIALSALGPPLRIATIAAGGLPDLTFHGRGYGHGVGMSQYGARGRALAGQLAPEILAHYFPKTAFATRSKTANVRVLLLSGFKATALEPLTVAGVGGRLTVDGIGIAFPANAILTLAPTAPGATTWILRVASPTGKILVKRVVTGDVAVRPTDETGLLKLLSKAATTNVFRGFLRIRLTATALVVNHVTIERYLRGVVPLEMPSTWPTEALRAQAIAARSYALYHVHPTTGLFDVYDDTRSQVYRGVGAERLASDLVISATAGTVLVSGTSLVNAMFHSADGGWTENNENVFVSATGEIVAGALTYLRGSTDRAPDGTSYDKASPYATWKTATYSATLLSAILARDSRTSVGALTAIDLSRRGVSGRLISVTLTGSQATKTVSGEVFRAAFNAGKPAADPALRGTLFSTAPIP